MHSEAYGATAGAPADEIEVDVATLEENVRDIVKQTIPEVIGDLIRDEVRAALDGLQLSARLSLPAAGNAPTPLNGSATPRTATSGPSSRGAPPRAARRAGKRIAMTDEFLKEVAEVYRSAEKNPNLAVQEAYGKSRSTVSQWIAKARERGFLPPTTPGKATA